MTTSILEVIVGMAVLIIGLETTLAAAVAGRKLSGHHEDSTVAVHLGETRMEELYLLPNSAPDMTNGTHVLYFDLTGAPSGAAGKYTVQWDITPDNPLVGIRRIVVSVGWQEQGRQQALTFTNFRN
jgi:hypothetical protein